MVGGGASYCETASNNVLCICTVTISVDIRHKVYMYIMQWRIQGGGARGPGPPP